jgi:hypothetical protein
LIKVAKVSLSILVIGCAGHREYQEYPQTTCNISMNNMKEDYYISIKGILYHDIRHNVMTVASEECPMDGLIVRFENPNSGYAGNLTDEISAEYFSTGRRPFVNIMGHLLNDSGFLVIVANQVNVVSYIHSE